MSLKQMEGFFATRMPGPVPVRERHQEYRKQEYTRPVPYQTDFYAKYRHGGSLCPGGFAGEP